MWVRSRFAARTMVLLSALGTAALGQDPASKDPDKVRAALRAIVMGKGELEPLTVTYDDLHPLHGGLRLTIRGNGKVEQKAVREPVGKRRHVKPEELRKLAALLVKEKAWEQRVPERAPQPDESRARLTIRYGKHTVQIWEWFNDLEKTKRIGKIRDYMKGIAWEPRKPAGQP